MWQTMCEAVRSVWSALKCHAEGGARGKKGGVAKSNHTVITGLARRAEERRYSVHYVYAVAQLGHFSCHTTRTTSTSTMTTNRDKFLMRVKLHISFCLLLYLFSWAAGSKGEKKRQREEDLRLWLIANFLAFWNLAAFFACIRFCQFGIRLFNSSAWKAINIALP